MSNNRNGRRAMVLGTVFAVVGLLGAGVAFSKTALAAPTLTSTPAAATTSRTATFAFTGPSGASFLCSLNGAAATACTSPKTYSSLPDARHTFSVVSVKSGEQSSATTYSWVVDNVAPDRPTITSSPTALVASNAATFAFSGPEAGLRYACALDGGAFTTCSSPVSYSSLGEGPHSFAVRATDAAGNTGLAATHSWRVDTVAPPAPVLTGKPSDPTSNATNDFTWTSAEPGVTFECSFENGSFSPCSTPYRWVIETDNYGQRQFAVRSRDAAGNVSTVTAYSFKYEKKLPDSGVPFQISGSVGNLAIGLWRDVNLTVTNPNSVAIYVSALNVGFAPDSTPAGCRTADNLEVQQSNISTTRTLIVPANGSITLPAQGVSSPRVRLRNLPTVNQDVCKGKSFTLLYSGTATN